MPKSSARCTTKRSSSTNEPSSSSSVDALAGGELALGVLLLLRLCFRLVYAARVRRCNSAIRASPASLTSS